MADLVASAADLARLVDDLPALPITWQRINEAASNPASTLDTLAELVASDQGLATRLLRLANSAFYGLDQRVDRIDRAVSLIGLRQVRSLALAVAVMDMFRELPPDLISSEQFWQHAIAVGCGARALAQLRRESETERHFVAGLLHDLGIAVIALRLPKVSALTLGAARSGVPLSHAERAKLGFDHADAGAALLERWRLPRSLAAPVGYHHSFLRSAPFAADVAAVHIAETVAEAIGYGRSGEHVVPPMSADAWELLGLQPNVLDHICTRMDTEVVELMAIFRA